MAVSKIHCKSSDVSWHRGTITIMHDPTPVGNGVFIISTKTEENEDVVISLILSETELLEFLESAIIIARM